MDRKQEKKEHLQPLSTVTTTFHTGYLANLRWTEFPLFIVLFRLYVDVLAPVIFCVLCLLSLLKTILHLFKLLIVHVINSTIT